MYYKKDEFIMSKLQNLVLIGIKRISIISFLVILSLNAIGMNEENNKKPNKSIRIVNEKLDEFDNIKTAIMQIVSDNNPEKILFVISLEKVIFTPMDKEFYVTKQDLQNLINRSLASVRDSKLQFANELILTEYKQSVIDQRVIDLLKQLQAKQVPIIVISRNVSGKFNKIQYLEEWTVNLLKKSGFDLSNGQFAGIRLYLDKYASKQRGSFPTFFDGLLSCSTNLGDNAEQTILTSLLVRLDYAPATLIMLHNDSNILDITGKQLYEIKPDLQYHPFKFISNKLEYNHFKSNELLKFWNNFAKKLNSVSRDESGINIGNPYETE